MSKTRLDALIFERGLAESRERAKAIIMGGNVYVGGSKAQKPGMQISSDAAIEVRGKMAYVSRGGQKLEKALDYFCVNPDGKICLDCGASTGGFTDCLLKNGARLVYAVDVGYGQLAWSIRSNPRVVTLERTNIRNMEAGALDPPPELAVIDVSFISLALVLPAVRGLLTDNSEVLCLIKPQFEAGREHVGKKGVVRDPAIHKAVLEVFMRNAAQSGFCVSGLTYSPVRGPEGNIEYLGWLRRQDAARDSGDEAVGAKIEPGEVVAESHRELISNKH